MSVPRILRSIPVLAILSTMGAGCSDSGSSPVTSNPDPSGKDAQAVETAPSVGHRRRQ